MGWFLGRPHTDLTPTTLEVFGIDDKAMMIALAMVSGICGAVRNIFFVYIVIYCPRLSCCSEAQVSATATALLLWLPEINIGAVWCFIPCVYILESS